ncbi:helix-turn-helix domain-containing protein [Chloroflexota bacterium]
MSQNDYPNSDDRSLTFSVPEAAKLLGLSKGNLYNQIRLKAIPCLCIGRRKLIPKAALLQWLENSGADSKIAETIRLGQQEHSPDGRVVEQENQRGAKDHTAVAAQHTEEVITKPSQPGIKHIPQKDNQNNDVAKDDMKRIADALEEIVDISKETDPGQGISPIVIG